MHVLLPCIAVKYCLLSLRLLHALLLNVPPQVVPGQRFRLTARFSTTQPGGLAGKEVLFRTAANLATCQGTAKGDGVVKTTNEAGSCTVECFVKADLTGGDLGDIKVFVSMPDVRPAVEPQTVTVDLVTVRAAGGRYVVV
jgi:hypothetical protein